MTGSTTASSTTAMDEDSMPPLLDPRLNVNTLREIQQLESIYAIKKTVDIYNTAVNHAAALAVSPPASCNLSSRLILSSPKQSAASSISVTIVFPLRIHQAIIAFCPIVHQAVITPHLKVQHAILTSQHHHHPSDHYSRSFSDASLNQR